MKATDVWTLGCYMTVFATVAEYCLVLFLVERTQWQQRVEERVGRFCSRKKVGKAFGEGRRRRSGWDSSEGSKVIYAIATILPALLAFRSSNGQRNY